MNNSRIANVFQNISGPLEMRGDPTFTIRAYRTDLKDARICRARQLGVPLIISTDAHTDEALGSLRYGAAVARRAWCEAGHTF